MPTTRFRGPSMTLANMRAQGVRSLDVICELCHHAAVPNVDAWPDELPVQWFAARIVCIICGIPGADAWPNPCQPGDLLFPKYSFRWCSRLIGIHANLL